MRTALPRALSELFVSSQARVKGLKYERNESSPASWAAFNCSSLHANSLLVAWDQGTLTRPAYKEGELATRTNI